MGVDTMALKDRIEEARKSVGTLDNITAIGILSSQLNEGDGFYSWGALGEGEEEVWQLRVPKGNIEGEEWLRKEAIEIVHVCNALAFLEAVERRDKESAAEHSCYVRDNSGNQLDAIEEFKCAKCNTPMPEKLAKVAKMQIDLRKMNQKIE
jgi:hypothetical protein